MVDPFKSMIDVQQAFFQGWVNMANTMMRYWTHMGEMQGKFLEKHAEYHRDHVEIARGPSLTDKYGKRAHDIDPEKDV